MALLFLLVSVVGVGDEAYDGDEEIDVAFDAFDGEHGDGFESYEEAYRRKQAATEEMGPHGVDDQLRDSH